jgi:hypothetical protein
MAKKSNPKPRAERKPAAPGSVRRITHTSIMDGVEGKASYKVYGIAKKAVIQNTPFGRIPGLKGAFEAIAPSGATLVSKRCFLSPEQHGEVAKLLKNKGDEVAFGVTVNVDGETVNAEFFAAPAPTDPMANLREYAQ